MILAWELQSMATWFIYRICGIFTSMAMLATIGQLADMYLCNLSKRHCRSFLMNDFKRFLWQ